MDEARRAHPDRKQLESFVHGELSEEEQSRVEQHVAECDSCCDVLRSIPHDALVERMQEADTSPPLDETQMMVGDVGGESGKDSAEIPPELVEHPRYKIIKKLGSGGMGVVYQAEHRLMERPVALKVVNARLINSDVGVERFRLEVKAAAKLSHRNIVAAHDAEQAGNVHFLVMEFIEGKDLSELVRQRGKLSVLHACNYVMQAAQGLQHAWEHGMVHRDIKPHNLMRTTKGTIKILDFGLARFASQQTAPLGGGLTSVGVTLGTPDYIAPEQARDSRTADIRADIYSLGCTLYYLLTGQTPFPRGTAMEKLVAHFEHDPTPLTELRADIPADVTRIVARMMAKEPEARFQTPAEVVEALKPFGKPGESAPLPTAAENNETAVVAEPAAQNTYVDLSPTQSPLDQLDLSEYQPAVLPGRPRLPDPYKRQVWAPDWREIWRRHRVQLAMAGIGLMIVLAGFAMFPTIRGIVEMAGNRMANTLADLDTEDWIDLLEQIDTSRDTVTGVWSKRGGELSVKAAPSARLVLPFDPPREYDFEVTFTRVSGSNSIALLFVAGGGQASFDIDGWGQNLAGIQKIDGLTMKENPTRVENRQLSNGRTYTALLRVRKSRVEAYLDGELLTSYDGDEAKLSMLDLWQLPDARAIGLGAYDSATTFHRIRVRPGRS